MLKNKSNKGLYKLSMILLLLISIAICVISYLYFSKTSFEINFKVSKEVEKMEVVKSFEIISCEVRNANGQLSLIILLKGNQLLYGNWNFFLHDYWSEELISTQSQIITLSKGELKYIQIIFPVAYSRKYYIVQVIPPEGNSERKVCTPV